MRHEAIIELYPNAKYISGNDAYNINEELIELDENLIKNKIEELEAPVPMQLLRLERNEKLAETDWVAIKAFTQGTQLSLEWKTYLQALRDLPATTEPQLDENGQLTNVTWPEVPE